jgi:glycosyltransferase involved in cell wall biosynthesis
MWWPRCFHIIAGLDPRHGGPSYSVPRLCAALRELGSDARILTVREADTPHDPFITAYKRDFVSVPVVRDLYISSCLNRNVARWVQAVDLFHVHALWRCPQVAAARAASAAGRPLIVSPRGMLGAEALAFSAAKKRYFWRFLQGPAYAHASAWHATSMAEAEEIRVFGIRAPIAMVPNGIDLPQGDTPPPQREGGQRTILHLGRIHPKKGLPDLIAAWDRLAGERPDWMLRIVGPDEDGHRTELEEMARQFGTPRVVFDGPIYSAEKVQLLREADLFVLPTRNENFGLTVAEALAAGVPAIVSRGAPWSGLETERCGWWTERGVEPLLGALRVATALPATERRAMGQRGHAWMARDFGWESVAARMLELYRWICGQGDIPEFIV